MRHQALGRRDLVAVLEASRACAEAHDLGEFAEAVVTHLPGVVGCDVASYDEIDQRAGGGFGRTNPADLFGADSRRLSDSYDVLTAYAGEHPLIPLAASNPEAFPLSWSDLRSAAEIHRMNLYDLIYRHTGQEDQLAAVLQGNADLIVGMTVDRNRRGFSERDRTVLDLFALQLKGVRRLVAEAEQLRKTAAALAPMCSSQDSDWKVALFGGFELAGPDGPRHLRGKPAELVKVLALAGGPVVLDQLIEQLWPEVDFMAARTRLRTLLHRLPHGRSPLVVRRGEALQLGPSVSVDVAAFEARATKALASARRQEPTAARLCEQALALYGSDLLPEDAYSDWAAGPRERLRRLRLALMDVLAADAERTGDRASAALLLAEAVDADPLDEARQLHLGWLYVSTGRRALALSICEDARRTAAELGLSLSPSWGGLLDVLDPR